jgi:hypothetical protein
MLKNNLISRDSIIRAMIIFNYGFHKTENNQVQFDQNKFIK